jgi:hypothetical protein
MKNRLHANKEHTYAALFGFGLRELLGDLFLNFIRLETKRNETKSKPMSFHIESLQSSK